MILKKIQLLILSIDLLIYLNIFVLCYLYNDWIQDRFVNQNKK